MRLGTDGRANPRDDSDEAHLLRPYNTVNGEFFLGAGLWDSLAQHGRLPAGRFTVTCDFEIVGALRSVALRWTRNGSFDANDRNLAAGAPQLRDPAMSVRQRVRATGAELAATIQGWRCSWRALSPTERATTVILTIMIAGGVALRLRNIGFPRFTFDEHHFVPNARRYLVGEADDNDHPPLGKLFIAAGMLLFGDNPTGWRAASLIFGLQTLVIAAALARRAVRGSTGGLVRGRVLRR